MHKEIKITQKGLPIENLNEVEVFFKDTFLKEYLKFSNDKKSSDILISELIKNTIRKFSKLKFNKKPEVNSHIIRL